MKTVKPKITTIAFSRNRACQLELLLRSLNIPVTVLYYYDPEFKEGYDRLIKMYPGVKFVLRHDFKKQLLELIKKGTQYTLFLVDDDIMIQPFSEDCPEFKRFKENQDILTLSLRMSPSYRRNKLPKMIKNTWNWQPFSKGGEFYDHRLRNFGYPMSIGSHIFRRADIIPIIEEHEMKNPNFLEGALSESPPNRPLMLCFSKPKLINNIVNQVQTDFPSHLSGILPEELEKKFLGGQRISLADIKEKAKMAFDCYLRTDYQFEDYDFSTNKPTSKKNK